MADTIVDPVDPVPPTQRDPDLAASAGKPALSSRRTARLIVLLAVFLLLGAATAVATWALVFRYKPTARAHVPAAANIVVRIDPTDIVLFGPVRNHLLSAVLEDKPQPATSQPSPKASFSDRLLERTGVRLPVDVREILVASMDGKSWVALFGGRIQAGKFVSGLAEVAREDGWVGYHLEGDVLLGPSVAVAQAEDGTIIVGTDPAIVNNALPATEEGTKLGLAKQGAVTFVIAKPAWEMLSKAGAVMPQTAAFGAVHRGSGGFVLGAAPEITLRLEANEAAELQAIEQGASALLSNLQLLMLLAPDRYGEKEALRQATVKREATAVIIRAPWPYEGLDRGVREFATRFRP